LSHFSRPLRVKSSLRSSSSPQLSSASCRHGFIIHSPLAPPPRPVVQSSLFFDSDDATSIVAFGRSATALAAPSRSATLPTSGAPRCFAPSVCLASPLSLLSLHADLPNGTAPPIRMIKLLKLSKTRQRPWDALPAGVVGNCGETGGATPPAARTRNRGEIRGIDRRRKSELSRRNSWANKLGTR
jgi:hypothetical protein